MRAKVFAVLLLLAVILLLPGCVSNPGAQNCEEYLSREKKSVELYSSCMQSKALYYAYKGDQATAVRVCDTMRRNVEATFGGGFVAKVFKNAFDPKAAFRLYNACITNVAVALDDEKVCDKAMENPLEKTLSAVMELAIRNQNMFLNDVKACKGEVRAVREQEQIYKDIWKHIFSVYQNPPPMPTP